MKLIVAIFVAATLPILVNLAQSGSVGNVFGLKAIAMLVAVSVALAWARNYKSL